jgi:hypothetical protein
MTRAGMKIASALKDLVVPSGREPRKVVAGPFKGITVDLSLRSETQVYLGLFERETHPWLERLSRSVRTAVDIGAAHGEHTLFFLMKTAAATVYAIEPDATCLPLLHENLRLNGMARSPRLNVCTKPIADSDGNGQICLDSLIESIDLPCLIKMDVDGAEVSVLRGAGALNALPGLRWLIETHSKENEDACLAILRGVGFQTRVIPNAWWRIFIPELRPIPHNRWLAAWKDA